MMKRSILFCMALLAVFSCTREEDWWQDEISRQARNDRGGRIENPFVREVHFRAEQTDTKAQFGELENGSYPTLWTSNDSQVKLSLNYGTAVEADVIKSDDSRSASFDASFDFSGVTGPYTFYSVSPASAAIALSPSREAWKVDIPCEQTPSATSADEDAIIIAAASASIDIFSSVSDVDLYFYHLTAYGRMSLSNLALGSGEEVQSVELTFSTPVSGNWFWKCDEENGSHELIDYGASSTIAITTSSTSDIWFGIAPVDVSEQIMIVSVYTSAGLYEQYVEFPANRKFTAGQAAVFTVDMDGADFKTYANGTPSDEFTLVTDASTLQAGDEVLIVYTAGKQALGAISSNGNYRLPAVVTISNGVIASAGSATILTLCEGSTSGTWAFKDGSNYLASAITSSNYLQNETSISDHSSWDVSISNGLATLHAKAGSRSYLLYNNDYTRFTCYDSANKDGMSKVSIYRRSSSSGQVVVDDPLLQESEYGCYLGTGLTWSLDAGAEQVSRSYDANGVQTYTLIDPEEVEELEIVGYKKDYVKGDSFTVTVRWRMGAGHVHSGSYSVTLIKEAGPKVWLSTGNGTGFIIKK